MNISLLKTKPRVLLGLGLVLALCLGIFLGWIIFAQKMPIVIKSVRAGKDDNSLINPVLYTNVPESLSFPKYSQLNTALSNYVTNAEEQNKATDIGVYYRDLNSSNWVGTHYSDTFDAASMLKVVTLIAVYHASEASNSILTANIAVPAGITIPSSNTQDYYPPTNPITPGKTYTVNYVLSQLITQSDNGADALLIDFIGNNELSQVFNDLNIPAPSSDTTISPQEYSHVFRVLYNASYLNSADSEQALELLSHTTFTQGLVAGVPAGTVVAHKFGERTYVSNGVPVHELHDCGIVYYPNNPYFICVMTRGSDFPTLAGVIKDLSKITWTQVGLLAGK